MSEFEPLRNELNAAKVELERLKSSNEKLNQIIRGDETIGLLGIPTQFANQHVSIATRLGQAEERVHALEVRIEVLEEKDMREKFLIRGAIIGLSITTTTGLGGLILNILEALGKIP